MQICGNSKYELAGVNGDVISLPLSFDNLPEKIQVKGETLYTPTPYHISLVCIGIIKGKYNIGIPDFINKIVEDFCEFTKENKIEITRYKDEYRFVDDKQSKKTVVVMCEVSNLDKFFDFINQKYKLNIKYPAPHVTLYNTLKGKPGIPLIDEDDLKNFTTIIKNPIDINLIYENLK